MATDPLAQVLKHPGAFALRTLHGFNRNQGLLLAGAVAYYTLLSIVPLLTLSIIVLSHIVGQDELLRTLGRYLEWLVPSQSAALMAEMSRLLENRGVIGGVLLATMLFFSSLAFTVLDKAMAVIFHHRGAARRHPLLSMLMPYLYVLCVALAFLAVAVLSTSLQVVGQESVVLLGREWSLHGLSGALLHLLGPACEIVFLTSLYWAMPAGRMPLRLAFLGGFTAAVLWELTRHVLVWYFSTLSQASVVYGSLTTAVVILLTLEIGAALLLLGAQTISEYERLAHEADGPSA